MKTTNWFPFSIKPVRVGLYEIEDPAWPDLKHWRWWNGKRWGYFSSDKASACHVAMKNAQGKIERRWRGLTKAAIRGEGK